MSIRNMMIGGAGASPPGAPTGVSAGSATTTTMSVSFSAPANNGGSAITSFTVTSSPDGVTATGSSSPITITGLTASTSYTFTVTATNAIGTGAASAASSAVSTPAAALYSFTSQTFTPAGAEGINGPTLVQLQSEYAGTPMINGGYLTLYSGRQGYQRWVVPATATYRIVCAGATGANPPGNYTPGRGAIITVDVSLTQAAVLVLLVGQRPGNSGYDSTYNGGAGGGSFVLREAIFSSQTLANIIVIAGGGAGGGYDYQGANPAIGDASLTETANTPVGGQTSGTNNGSTGVNGGNQSSSAGAAGGGISIFSIPTNFSYTGNAVAPGSIILGNASGSRGFYNALNGGGGHQSGFPGGGAGGNHAGGGGSGFNGGGGGAGNANKSAGGSSYTLGATLFSSGFQSSSYPASGVNGYITITKL